MVTKKKSGRPNQQNRTRKDLLAAAARLLKRESNPSLEQIAQEALISRATAYRHFPNVDALLAEACVDIAIPDTSDLFPRNSSTDPIARLQRLDSALQKTIADNEIPLRIMLAHSLKQRIGRDSGSDIPIRQNRRTPLIEEALEPALKQFEPAQLKNLIRALALVIGTEAMVVFRDVLQLSDAEAQKVKRWTIQALVDAARNGRAVRQPSVKTNRRKQSNGK